jgi:hypothetical protein
VRASRDLSHQPFHLVVMHALGVPSLLTCPRDPPSRRRSRSIVTVVRTSSGCCRVHLKETLPRSCPSGSTVRPLPPRRRAQLMGPLSRVCPRDPMSQPLPPHRRACLRGTIAARWPQGSAAASVFPGFAVASMSPRFAVARLLPGSATVRAS